MKSKNDEWCVYLPEWALKDLDVVPKMTAVVSRSAHCPRTWSLLLARKHEGPGNENKEADT